MMQSLLWILSISIYSLLWPKLFIFFHYIVSRFSKKIDKKILESKTLSDAGADANNCLIVFAMMISFVQLYETRQNDLRWEARLLYVNPLQMEFTFSADNGTTPSCKCSSLGHPISRFPYGSWKYRNIINEI
jgi:hypothetical protein